MTGRPEEAQVLALRAWFEKDGPEVERIWSYEVRALCDSWLAQRDALRRIEYYPFSVMANDAVDVCAMKEIAAAAVEEPVA